MTKKFETQFLKFVSRSLRQAPDGLEGYVFNLFQKAWIDKSSAKFEVELIGIESVDEKDVDWGCKEDFVPKPRSIEIPLDYSSEDWKECELRVLQLLGKLKRGHYQNLNRLKNAKQVAVGFVDGDLTLLKN